jgi:hypothetical protein
VSAAALVVPVRGRVHWADPLVGRVLFDVLVQLWLDVLPALKDRDSNCYATLGGRAR